MRRRPSPRLQTFVWTFVIIYCVGTEAVTALCSMLQLGLDPCVFWLCLDTMVRQLRATGDTNLASYSRHLATHHQLQLSSCQLYIQVNR